MNKYAELEQRHNALIKEVNGLLNYMLKIKRKCEAENMWLIASFDPYKPLTTEQQQGPMISRMFEMVTELKKKLK